MATTRLIYFLLIFSVAYVSAVPLWCGRPYYGYNRTDAEFAKPNNYFVVNPSIEPFTTEKNGQLLVKVDPNYGTDVVFQASYHSIFIVSPIRLKTGTRNDLAIDVTKLPMGQYSQVNCIIKNDKGEILATKNVTVSRWPHKSNSIKIKFPSISSLLIRPWQIDHKSDGLISNGLPILPMGFYYDWGRTEIWDVIVEEATLGFTTPLPYRPPLTPLTGIKQMFDLGHKAGIKMTLDMTYITESANSKEKFGNITAIVNGMKDHPALLAYYIGDEPDGSQVDPSELISSYNFIKQLDPYHPVILVLNCLYGVNNYTQAVDILMTDPYPIGITDSDACDYCKGEPMDVWNRFTAYRTQTHDQYPLWLVEQSFGGAEEWTRAPTAAEARAMTYLALLNHVRGVIFFTEGKPFTGLWANCRQLAEEMLQLTPWFLSHEAANEIVIEAHDVDVAGAPNSNVKGSAYLHQGYLMVVLVNGKNSVSDVRITIKGMSSSVTEALVIFEQNRSVKVSNGVFRDVLDGYASSAYRLEVKSHALMPETLLRNPSFELTPNVGVPDAYNYYFSYGSSCMTDTRTAVDGLNSLRVTCFNASCGDTNDGNYKYYNVQAFSITLTAGQTYQGSFYLKGDSAGITFAFYMPGHNGYMTNQVYTSTTEWQKLVIQPFKVDTTGGYYSRFIILTPGTVWIDAITLTASN